MTVLAIVLLVLCGFVMLAVELLLIPGFSIPGIMGIGLIVYGVWRSRQAYDIEGALVTIILSAVGAFLIVKFAARSRAVRAVGLPYDQKGYTAPEDRSALAGKEGIALSPLRPVGTALIEGNRVDVVTEGDFIEKDTPIRVIGVEGTRVIVTGKEERSS